MTLIKVNNPQKGRIGFGLSPLFDETFNDFVNGGNSLRSLYNKNVAVNIHETEKSFNIDFAAPGFDKTDFKINLENNTLTVTAEKKTEENVTEKNYTKREFSFNSFSRSFTLPENITYDAIKAEYKNGILQLELPKEELPKKSVKEISVM